MIERRLDELLTIAPPNVFVSIDYLDEAMSATMKATLKKYEKIWPNNSSINFHIHTQNQGLVRHITQTITKSLEIYECAVIIEDDISISKGFYESALKYMNSTTLRSDYASFGGFSVFPSMKVFEKFNKFRSTPYFACWGWVIARENWSGYKSDLSTEEIAESLNQSKLWNSLHKKQRQTWNGRFQKVSANPTDTWDIQFQYHTLKMDKLHLVPIIRVVDNEGFSDSRGTHTQMKRPRNIGKFNFSKNIINSLVKTKWINEFFVFFESLIFYEDIRMPTIIKKIAKIILKP